MREPHSVAARGDEGNMPRAACNGDRYRIDAWLDMVVEVGGLAAMGITPSSQVLSLSHSQILWII
ncbi:DUF2269 domain-containing protein [Sesbania bispinosa]|nr:DUF2269 domain-containing protein [Sesbania bispinosa]